MPDTALNHDGDDAAGAQNRRRDRRNLAYVEAAPFAVDTSYAAVLRPGIYECLGWSPAIRVLGRRGLRRASFSINEMAVFTTPDAGRALTGRQPLRVEVWAQRGS